MSTPVSYPNRAGEMRQRLFGRRATPVRPITVKSGATYWLRPCTLEQRGRIMQAGGLKAGETPDLVVMTRVTALAAIALVVDELGAPVFEASDLDRLLASEVGDEEQELMDAAGAAMGGQRTGEASGEVGVAASPSSSPTA